VPLPYKTNIVHSDFVLRNVPWWSRYEW